MSTNSNPPSPESSRNSTVFSQGPPSHNTRSSIMNRTRPTTTPPVSYLVAMQHIQQREDLARLQTSNERDSPVAFSNLSPDKPPSIHSSPLQTDNLPMIPTLKSSLSRSPHSPSDTEVSGLCLS